MTEKLKIFNPDGSVTEVEPLKMWTPDPDACPNCEICQKVDPDTFQRGDYVWVCITCYWKGDVSL